MSLKETFRFSSERKCWINSPFLISNKHFETADSESLNDCITTFTRNQNYYKDEAKKVLLHYARNIDFFSKEEFEDLEFDFGQAILLFQNRKFYGFRLTYSVKDDGTQKISWKDVYGIWTVDIIDNVICNACRVTMINFD